MDRMEDSDIGLFPGRDVPPLLSEIRPAWTFTSRNVFVAESVPAFAAVEPLGRSEDYPPHAHDFIEIYVVGSGKGLHVGANGAVVLEPGTVVVVRPGAWHTFHRSRDVVVAMIGISAAALGSDLAFLRARPSTRDLLYAGPIGGAARGIWVTEISPAAASDVLDETRRLAHALRTRPRDTLLLLGHLITVLGMITGGMTAPESRQPIHPAVAAVLDRLEAAPERPWSVADLAEVANLDEAYLTRLFRANVGVPPIAYLARLRAEKAANLLTVTMLPVYQVGARVGWSDPAYFSRRFHSLIGLSPTEYRQRMSSDDRPLESDAGSAG